MDASTKRFPLVRLAQTVFNDDIRVVRAKWREHAVESQGIGQRDAVHRRRNALKMG